MGSNRKTIFKLSSKCNQFYSDTQLKYHPIRYDYSLNKIFTNHVMLDHVIRSL